MKYILILILSVTLFVSESLYSQEIEVKTSLKKYELIPAPFFNYSKILGFGYGIAPMILYRVSKKDTISPKSFSGLLAAYTTNESYLFIAFSRFYFYEDDWRLSIIGGKGDVNFQFYLDLDFPVGGFYDYNSDFSFAGISTLAGSVNDDFNWKLYPSIGTGIRYNFLKKNKVNVGLDLAVGKDDWGLYFRIGEAF